MFHDDKLKHIGQQTKAPTDEAGRGFRKGRSLAGLKRVRLPREWDSSPPIVVTIVSVVTVAASVVIVVAVASTITETVNVADVSQFVLYLRPL